MKVPGRRRCRGIPYLMSLTLFRYPEESHRLDRLVDGKMGMKDEYHAGIDGKKRHVDD